MFFPGSNRNARHKMSKRVQVVKKEEVLGEDTNRIDEAEYKLQSMISPETHEANRFFNRPPSKQIGGLRVDTLSPAQVSFIQSSTQWHKYFKPSSPSRLPSNIFPDDPVLFPGMKSAKNSDSVPQRYTGGGFDGLENPVLPKHHRPNYDNWNSYGDMGEGTDQRQKDYGDTQKDFGDTPFTDKSWMNPPKSEERPPGEGFESFDGKSVAVPEPKQDESPEQLARFEGHSEDQEILRGGGVGLGGIRHNGMLEDQKARLLEKLDQLKETAMMPQEGDEKMFFGGGNPKLLSKSPPPLGPSGGLGTALAEELLQKNKNNFQKFEDSTEIIQGRSGAADDLDELRLATRPELEERASQRTLVYNHLNDLDRGSHVVRIRSQKLKDNSVKMPITGHLVGVTHNKHQTYVKDKTIHEQRKNNHDTLGQKTQDFKPKKIATDESLTSVHKRICKRCSSSLQQRKHRNK